MENFILERVRFHLTQPDTIVFSGWFLPMVNSDAKLVVLWERTELECDIKVKKGVDIRQKHIGERYEINEEIEGIVRLPADWQDGGKLFFACRIGDTQENVRVFTAKYLCKKSQRVDYHIENVRAYDGKVEISGWAVSDQRVDFGLSKNGKAIDYEINSFPRRDVENVFFEMESGYPCGFKISVPWTDGNIRGLKLQLRSGHKKADYAVSMSDNRDDQRVWRWKNIDKGIRYLKKYGAMETIQKLRVKMAPEPYALWRSEHEITREELSRQRETEFEQNILFSIAVPLFHTNPKFLTAMVESFRNQTYSNWELCLADGSGDDSPLRSILESYSQKDKRIKYRILPENRGIAGNTNAALEMATGQYILLADHDDLVPANALYEFADALSKDSTIDVIYTDEDKVSMDGKRFFDPHFKSDANIDLLCSLNYVCHLFGVSRAILNIVQGQDPSFDGAQDYDFILRCFEAANHIHHIPKILYHWRCHTDSTAENPESKRYAFEAGRRAVEAHYSRIGVPAKVEHSEFYGMYRTRFEWPEKPLVSIIIPNKDHVEDLKKCLQSIEQQQYTNYEIVIVENNSTEQETFDYYKGIESDHIHVVYFEGDFNFSKINNFGAKYAKGEYLLLLNNDTEMIYPTCLEELLGYCMRDDVGAVGARLYYEDDTIQHAGVVMGFGGIAGHTFIGKSRYDIGYFGRIICAQNYSAVTAACLMTKRQVFDEVGGLSEDLKVAFNDIDFCMKIISTGKLIVYNPYAELYHYESKSRGMEDTPEKIERFHGEMALFNEKWGEYIEKGDPYYNVNLTLNSSDFSLRV